MTVTVVSRLSRRRIKLRFSLHLPIELLLIQLLVLLSFHGFKVVVASSVIVQGGYVSLDLVHWSKKVAFRSLLVRPFIKDLFTLLQKTNPVVLEVIVVSVLNRLIVVVQSLAHVMGTVVLHLW